jgi:hypothetical protein
VESRSGGTASTLDGGTLKSSGLGFQLHGIYMLPKVLKNCFECCTLDKYLSLKNFTIGKSKTQMEWCYPKSFLSDPKLLFTQSLP